MIWKWSDSSQRVSSAVFRIFIGNILIIKVAIFSNGGFASNFTLWFLYSRTIFTVEFVDRYLTSSSVGVNETGGQFSHKSVHNIIYARSMICYIMWVVTVDFQARNREFLLQYIEQIQWTCLVSNMHLF